MKYGASPHVKYRPKSRCEILNGEAVQCEMWPDGHVKDGGLPTAADYLKLKNEYLKLKNGKLYSKSGHLEN